MHAKEIENISSLKPFERYRYFMGKIADFEVLYSLKSKEGNYAISESENLYMFPMWSHKEFAQLNLDSGWENFEIIEISLDKLEKEIIPFISDNNYRINVFPLNNKTGFVVNIEEFRRDLDIELEDYQ